MSWPCPFTNTNCAKATARRAAEVHAEPAAFRQAAHQCPPARNQCARSSPASARPPSSNRFPSRTPRRRVHRAQAAGQGRIRAAINRALHRFTPDYSEPSNCTNTYVQESVPHGRGVVVAVLVSGCAGPSKKLGRGVNNFLEPIRLAEWQRSVEQAELFGSTQNGLSGSTGMVRGFNKTIARAGWASTRSSPSPFQPTIRSGLVTSRPIRSTRTVTSPGSRMAPPFAPTHRWDSAGVKWPRTFRQPLPRVRQLTADGTLSSRANPVGAFSFRAIPWDSWLITGPMMTLEKESRAKSTCC